MRVPWGQVHCELMWQMWKDLVKPWRTLCWCNIFQHEWFAGGSVMAWGGISMEGHTDPTPWLSLGWNHGLTVKTLSWCIWSTTMLGLVPKVCRMLKFIPDLILWSTFGTLCFGPSDNARLHLRLSRSSEMPWSRSGSRPMLSGIHAQQNYHFHYRWAALNKLWNCMKLYLMFQIAVFTKTHTFVMAIMKQRL